MDLTNPLGVGLYINDGNESKVELREDGAGLFSGAVNAGDNVVISKDDGCYVQTVRLASGTSWRTGINGDDKWYIYQPVGGGYDAVSALVVSPGTGNAKFSGTVTVEGNRPVSTKVDLIETLATLRQATMDETQDIRVSLRSAIDELISGFEQEIATMPAPEPEVSTMEEAE